MGLGCPHQNTKPTAPTAWRSAEGARTGTVTKDGRKVDDQDTKPWPEGFTELDGGLIEDLGTEGAIFQINYDTSYHNYRMSARGEVGSDIVTEKYILGMRILMLGYERVFRTLKNETEGAHDEGISEHLD